MVNIPIISSFAAKKPGERSISTWKTETVGEKDGRRYIRITEGSDCNEQFLNRIFAVVRYEFSGEKIIFDTNRALATPQQFQMEF